MAWYSMGTCQLCSKYHPELGPQTSIHAVLYTLHKAKGLHHAYADLMFRMPCVYILEASCCACRPHCSMLYKESLASDHVDAMRAGSMLSTEA